MFFFANTLFSFFPGKTGNAVKTGMFPNCGNLTEGKISGTLSIELFGKNRKSAKNMYIAKKKMEIWDKKKFQ